MKNCIPFAIGLLVATGLGARAAHADYVVTLTGKPGTSLVHWTVSGGGTFTIGPSYLGSLGIESSIDLFGPELDAATPFIVSGDGILTNTTTNEVVSINKSSFGDSMPTPDYFGMQFAPWPTVNPGDTFTLAGSGTLDLSTQGLLFDHMNTGIAVDPSNTVHSGSSTLIIRAVPEPSTLMLATFGVASLGMICRRRRRR